MPKYNYFLIEKTVLSVVIEANNIDEANEKAGDIVHGGDVDWGMGEMETDYEFNGELKNE